MVLLSAAGYHALEIEAGEIPNDPKGLFRSGMKVSPLHVENGLQTWDDPYQVELHAMILLAHENREELATEVLDIEKQLRRFCNLIHLEEGEKRIDPLTNQAIENFGYADGMSQPLLIVEDIEEEKVKRGADIWNPQASLDLVLIKEPDDDTYGSFMAFQKLEQHVDKFENSVRQLAEKSGKSLEEAGARIVGRYKDGRPLIDTLPVATTYPQ
jgi:deferrochelatase/peroxidase EfeB